MRGRVLRFFAGLLSHGVALACGEARGGGMLPLAGLRFHVNSEEQQGKRGGDPLNLGNLGGMGPVLDTCLVNPERRLAIACPADIRREDCPSFRGSETETVAFTRDTSAEASVEEIGRFQVDHVLGVGCPEPIQPCPAMSVLRWLLLQITCHRERMLWTLAGVVRPIIQSVSTWRSESPPGLVKVTLPSMRILRPLPVHWCAGRGRRRGGCFHCRRR